MTNRSILRRAFARFPRLRTHAALALLSALSSAVLALCLPALAGRAVDLLPGSRKVDFAALSTLLLWMAGVSIAAALCRQLTRSRAGRVARQAASAIREDALARIRQLPPDYPDPPAPDRAAEDADALSDFLLHVPRFAASALILLGALTRMLCLSAGTAVVVMLLAPASMFMEAYLARRAHAAPKLPESLREERDALIAEIISGVNDVQAFGQERACEQRLEAIDAQLEKISPRSGILAALPKLYSRTALSLISMSTAALGALSAIAGGATVGQLFCLTVCAHLYVASIRAIPGAITELQRTAAHAARILALPDETAETPEIAEEAV